MTKKKQSTQIILGPVPPALIGCGSESEKNIITLAWVGVVNSSPPLISAAVRPNRHSHQIIRASGELTVNLARADQLDICDGCGTLSGRDLDKFEHFSLTPVMGTLKHAPLIEECPVGMDCRVEQTVELGSHTLFIARVVATYLDEEYTLADGKLDFDRLSLLGFCAGSYLQTAALNRTLGYSQKK